MNRSRDIAARAPLALELRAPFTVPEVLALYARIQELESVVQGVLDGWDNWSDGHSMEQALDRAGEAIRTRRDPSKVAA